MPRRAGAERSAQAERMRAARARARDLDIPACENPRRRRRCGDDTALFLRTYLPGVFYHPFSANQLAIIGEFDERSRYGGWKAEASPRGEGKTSIARGCIVRAILYGQRKFPLLVAATHPRAMEHRNTIADWFERNELLLADFPEVCAPIRALEGAAQRASAQTAEGRRTYLEWGGEFLVFPRVEGSPAAGAIIGCVGITGAIHGLNYLGKRPDFVLIDDPETEETARSAVEVEQRERVIEKSISPLGPPDRRITILLTCTVWENDSVSDRFTDPKRKPAWAGSRRKLLVEKPDRDDLWERYVALRLEGAMKGDKTGREAHRFYLEHRDEMDAGAEVSNLYRFDDQPLPDGSQLQVSALQFCYDAVADIGWEGFAAEYQNEPVPPEADDSLQIDATHVMKRVNGLDRGTVPENSDWLTAGIDIGGRALHWTVMAWKGACGYVVDYDAIPVHSPVVGSLVDPENAPAVQEAILAALREFRDGADGGWPDTETGEMRPLDVALVDTGYARSAMDEPVWEFVRESPGKVYRAAKGFGVGNPAGQYRHPAKGKRRSKRIYNHAFATRQAKRRDWLYHLDADWWKAFVHSGLVAAPDRPGSITLFGRDPVEHRHYARHLTAEQWTHEHKPNRGDVWYWKRLRHRNHWFDTTYMAAAAAGTLGLRTVGADVEEARNEGKAMRKASSPAPRRSGRRRISKMARYAR